MAQNKISHSLPHTPLLYKQYRQNLAKRKRQAATNGTASSFPPHHHLPSLPPLFQFIWVHAPTYVNRKPHQVASATPSSASKNPGLGQRKPGLVDFQRRLQFHYACLNLPCHHVILPQKSPLANVCVCSGRSEREEHPW